MSFEVENTFWVRPNSIKEMFDVMYVLRTPIFRYVDIFKLCYMIVLILGDLAHLEIS